MSRLPPRRLVLFGALGLSLAATAWFAVEDDDGATAPEASQRPARTASTGTLATATPRSRGDWPAPDPQARAAWGEVAPVAAGPALPPAAPAEAADEPPAPPAPPPFPYQFVGRMSDGATRAILTNALRTAVVGVGEVVEGQWRVDAVDAGGLRLTYLPLGQAQFVPFASSPSA